jgi:hypothetical protein
MWFLEKPPWPVLSTDCSIHQLDRLTITNVIAARTVSRYPGIESQAQQISADSSPRIDTLIFAIHASDCAHSSAAAANARFKSGHCRR